MAGLVPAISLMDAHCLMIGIAGTSPAMTGQKAWRGKALPAIAPHRRLAAAVAELRQVVLLGALPLPAGLHQRRARTMPEMGEHPPREQDVGLECDADDLLVVRRRHLEPRQLRFGAADRRGFAGAVSALGEGRDGRADARGKCQRHRNRPIP